MGVVYYSIMGVLFYCSDVDDFQCKEVVKMTREELLKIINSEPYDFLRTNLHLNGHLMYLTIGGSHAYGTNVEGSDVDVRGVALNSREDLLGLGTFEHWVDETTDTTIFGFKKAVKLMCSGNPNMLEQLGNADDLVISYHPATKLLMENKKLFLSRQVVYSFGGFAGKLFEKSIKLGEWCNQHPEDQITKKRMNKTIMNMIRLYLMVFDILEKGEIITNRAENHDLLMLARNGEFQAANGYIKHDVKDFHKEYEKRLLYDKENTTLPDHVNMKLVNELVMTINEQALKVA
nr:MAG TPA: putative nucleotidyltransferase [Siphoviridae sp. ctHdl3]